MRPDIALFLLRLTLAAIFPLSAYNKIVAWPRIVDTVANGGMPLPYVASMVGVAIEAICPFLLLLGVGTRSAAIGLMIYTASASVIGHPFWRVSSAEFFMNYTSFAKNLSMMAGLLAIAMLGPGRFAIEPSHVTVQSGKS